MAYGSYRNRSYCGYGEVGMQDKIVQELKSITARNSQLASQLQCMKRESQENTKKLEKKIAELEVANQRSTSPISCTEAIPLGLVRDIFDIEFEEELEGMYTKKLWSELEVNLKNKMVEHIKDSLSASGLKIPKTKDAMNRLRGFYANRRSTYLMKSDQDKWRKRKLAVKASRQTYLAREEAVKKAVQDGSLNPKNQDEVSRIRKNIPRIALNSVSPVESSDDEEAAEENRKKRRLETLARAREAKKMKRELSMRRRNAQSTMSHLFNHETASHEIDRLNQAESDEIDELIQMASDSPPLFDSDILARDTYDDDETQLQPNY